jgi:hypothetical protein
MKMGLRSSHMSWQNAAMIYRPLILSLLCLSGVAACVAPRYIRMPTAAPGTVEVYGYVKRQGSVRWKEGMTLTDCIDLSGGFAPLANRHDLHLYEPVLRRDRIMMWQGRVPFDTKANPRAVKDGSILVIDDRMPSF